MGQIIYYGVVIRSPEDTESRQWELSAPGRDVIVLDTDELVKRIFTPLKPLNREQLTTPEPG